MASYKGKNIIIVGGSTGIGFSGAQRLVSNGAHVLIIGRNEENLRSAQEKLGGDTEIFCGDASDSSVVTCGIQQLKAQNRQLHGLYHVAGGSGRSQGDGPLHEITDEGLEFTLSLNLKSFVYSNRAAVQTFLKQNSGGVILNTGSVLGFSPSPKFFSTHAYAATKSAVIGFTKSIASYYASENIRANVIAPALIETPMSERASKNQEIQKFISSKQPLEGGRIGVPSDLDGTVELLLSDEARFITGQVIGVDGGWSVSEGQIPGI